MSNIPNGSTPSRLLTNTDSLRSTLIARNLYTPNNIYPITEKTQVQNVVNSVSSIIDVISPFKSISLKNTYFARLVTSSTPLSEIGLAMLGTQFAYNSMSHIAQQNFPTIKLANLFDGNKNTHLFTNNIDFSITKKKATTNFQEFLESMISFNPQKQNPFKGATGTNQNTVPSKNNSYIQNKFYIENTGTGQLSFLINAFNQNIYKEGFGNTPTDIALQKYSTDAKFKFYKRNNLIGSYSNPTNKYENYFNFFKAENNPYSTLQLMNINSINDANGAMVNAMNSSNSRTKPTQEYAPDLNFINLNFGKTVNTIEYPISETQNTWINTNDEFTNNNNYDVDNKIVWGKNGISDAANEQINYLRGSFNSANDRITGGGTGPLPNVEFNAYSGLLEYTRNLLNASEGSLVDITRKAFLNGKNVEGFNGSSLWVTNNSKYATDSNTAGKSGVRQHSMIDQYDRFAKAIRFNGNKVYDGNPNSVIYNTVMPRIHPTIDKETGKLNQKNLMFSLENLAVRVISSNEGYGIIDDEYGSTIPACEIGQFNGRLMWFPPYDISINETTSAKYESTVMVGRNEPMYSYQNSERNATLSFTLLVDYPMQLKDAFYQGTDKHKIISEFFAFGGDPYKPITPLINPPKKIDDLQQKKTVITGPTATAGPDVLQSAEVQIVFPNDFPKESEVITAIDNMYKTYQYQISEGCLNASGHISQGYNNNIFIQTGVTGRTDIPTTDPNYKRLHTNLLPLEFSQYTSDNSTNSLNQVLLNVYANPNNRKYYTIYVVGGASKLYTENNPNDVKQEQDYNNKLGLRRARAAVELIRQRIKVLFGQFPENLGITVEYKTDTPTGTPGSTGSVLAKQSNATAAAMENEDTIQERYAKITVKRNSIVSDDIKPIISSEDAQNIDKINKDSAAAENLKNNQTNNGGTSCVYNERTIDSDAILGGFKSISGNYYYPAFHSQTPEDFHKRLTFLQQCMRQGAAKHYAMVEEKGNLRAKNSVFGRQPICVLRVGDFFFTKVIIENLTIDYSETTWDMNPEGFGLQPLMAKVTLQMKVIGGQSLKGPIDALQNAITFNYYANSNFSSDGMYKLPSSEADKQDRYMNGIDGVSGILGTERDTLTKAYNNKFFPKAK